MSGDLVGNIRREIEYSLYKRHAEALGEVRFSVILLPEHLCPPSEMERYTVPIPNMRVIQAGGDQENFVLKPVPSGLHRP